MNMAFVCCCDVPCCATTSYTITTVPSLVYSLTCGTDQEYVTISKNLNLPGYNPVIKGVVAPPLGCSLACNYTQVQPSGGIFCACFHPRCSGLGVTWTYTAYASIKSFRNFGGTYTHELGIFHLWSTSGFGAPAPFTVGCTWVLTKTDKCPNGTYAAFNSGWIDCNGVPRTTGTNYSLSAGGPTKPTIVFGAPSTVPVVA